MHVVIDTNIALDLLVFGDPGCAALARALESRALRWLARPEMRDELARVLGYPAVATRLDRTGCDPRDVLAAFDARVQWVHEAPPPAPCACTDPDDQVFIDLAVAWRARLLSKDRAVLALRRPLAALGVEVGAALAVRARTSGQAVAPRP